MKAQYLIESSTNEWYTPHHIIDSVKAVFGGVIGLDPYSCDAANSLKIGGKLVKKLLDKSISAMIY